MTKPKLTQVQINQEGSAHASPCPSCGYCPTCGRRNTAPAYPYWPYPYMLPYNPYQWTVTSGAQTTTSTLTVLIGNAITVSY